MGIETAFRGRRSMPPADTGRKKKSWQLSSMWWARGRARALVFRDLVGWASWRVVRKTKLRARPPGSRRSRRSFRDRSRERVHEDEREPRRRQQRRREAHRRLFRRIVVVGR